MRIDWSTRALADLETIAEWITQDRGLNTANRVATAIVDAVETLAYLPYRGRQGRRQHTRELVMPRLPYLVIYRVHTDCVVILAVLHGSQKWPES